MSAQPYRTTSRAAPDLLAMNPNGPVVVRCAKCKRTVERAREWYEADRRTVVVEAYCHGESARADVPKYTNPIVFFSPGDAPEMKILMGLA